MCYFSINYNISCSKSWRQHPTRRQLYVHLLPIMKTIQVRQARHAGHCWRSKDELVSDVLLWTPTYGQEKAGRPARTYIQQLCEDTGCNPEDLPEAMKDREKWREMVRDIRAGGTTWWWWWWWWYFFRASDMCDSKSPWVSSILFGVLANRNKAVVYIQPLIPISFSPLSECSNENKYHRHLRIPRLSFFSGNFQVPVNLFSFIICLSGPLWRQNPLHGKISYFCLFLFSFLSIIERSGFWPWLGDL